MEFLPSSPGVYIFCAVDGEPLYIGKSVNLKSRLKQHLENALIQSQKASKYVPLTVNFMFQVVESDLAAIILEANLIKAHQPRFNSMSKDDKSACFLCFGNYPQSWLKVFHQTDLDRSYFDQPATQIYGPYASVYAANILLDQIRRIFGFCQAPNNPQHKSCFYFHLHQCPGVCNGTMSVEEYAKHLTKIKLFLSGQFGTLRKDLTKTINLLAKKQQYEEAGLVKRTIDAIDHALNSRRFAALYRSSGFNESIMTRSLISLGHPKLHQVPRRLECFDLAHLQKTAYVGAMTVFENLAANPKQYRLFKLSSETAGDQNGLREVVTRRLLHIEWPKPDLIILDGGVSQLSTVAPVVPDDIPLMAISKKRETLHFYDSNGKIVNKTLPLHHPFLQLVQQIRDEAHRFGTSFHQRSKIKVDLTL